MMQLVETDGTENSYLMMQLVATDKHVCEFVGDFRFQEATVDEILSHFLNFIDARVGRVITQVVFNVLWRKLNKNVLSN